MSLSDLLIIYLAFGAPFGVYFFLSHRRRKNRLFLKSIFISAFWFPFAFRLLHRNITKGLINKLFDKNSFSDADFEIEIEQTKKDLEKVFIKCGLQISLFDFREMVERYIGLTLVSLNDDALPSEREIKIYEISGHSKKKLAAKCLQRRNRKLLSYHQNLARRDFIQFVSSAAKERQSSESVENLTLKLARLLDDGDAEKSLTHIFAGHLQSRETVNVSKPEKDLWKTEQQKPQTAKAIQISIQPPTAKLNLPIKD